MRKILHVNFPEINEQITYFLARLFTYARLRSINRTAKIKNSKRLRDHSNITSVKDCLRGPVTMGSMGSAEPINFQLEVLKPINCLSFAAKNGR